MKKKVVAVVRRRSASPWSPPRRPLEFHQHIVIGNLVLDAEGGFSSEHAAEAPQRADHHARRGQTLDRLRQPAAADRHLRARIRQARGA